MNLPPALTRILPEDFSTDTSLLSLIAVNIITIVLAVAENWDPATVLFVYWAQSIIIGFFAAISILGADTTALAADMNQATADETGKKAVWSTRGVGIYKGVMAGFFCLHYGLFHWVYFSFIVESGLFGPVDFSGSSIWAACALFFANHLYSYLSHRQGERQGAAFVTEEFFRPYNRIIPMHLTIIFGSIVVLVLQLLGFATVLPALVLFLILKTYMDIRMHIRKHYEAVHPDEPKQFIVF